MIFLVSLIAKQSLFSKNTLNFDGSQWNSLIRYQKKNLVVIWMQKSDEF